jgi:hypothetical protein
VPSDVLTKDPTNLRRELVRRQPLAELADGLVKVGTGLHHNIEQMSERQREGEIVVILI